jgi:hypothetical protein
LRTRAAVTEEHSVEDLGISIDVHGNPLCWATIKLANAWFIMNEKFSLVRLSQLLLLL